jgi:hypothetical protein
LVANGLSHGLKIARQLSIFTPVCGLVPPFQVPFPSKKSNTEWCWTLFAGAPGLECQVSGVYGIFKTFIRTKSLFCIKYSNIFN